METAQNSEHEVQEPKKKRRGLLIILLVLLALLIFCCLGSAVFCSLSGGISVWMDQIYQSLEEQGFDPGSIDPERFQEYDPESDSFSVDPEAEIQTETDSPQELLEGAGCPGRPTEFFLEISHSWDFSPNRDLQSMRVDGTVDPPFRCPLTIDGSQVIIEPCQVPFSCTGFLETDAGTCDITVAGFAELTFEDASCSQGVVTMTIVETLDTEAETTGTMDCPNISQPYIPFYPYSRSVESFQITPQGFLQEENADPDISNQFRYQKVWRLIPAE